MWRDEALLLDILLAARDALEFSRDLTRESFASSKLHQHAIVRVLGIVGEAAGKVSREFRDAHPEVPWKQIVGLRNRLIHDYTNVDLARVWEVVTEHVPELIARIEPLVPPPDEKS
jgi:uncharacterized protein with HEPN domain